MIGDVLKVKSVIEQNLEDIQQSIAEFELKFHRKPKSVRLLAASKHQSVEKMNQAIAAGQHCFGENYLQEALEKMALLPDPTLEWHFIGSLQSNKTKKIAEHFSWVHSVDNKKHALRLNMHRPLHLPPLNICIEVNISHEKSKAGTSFEEVLELADFCESLPRLKLRGLMTIPAPADDVALQRKPFHALAMLFSQLQKTHQNIDTLSMGMSEDYEAAIAEGTTLLRIGTAIFGERITP